MLTDVFIDCVSEVGELPFLFTLVVSFLEATGGTPFTLLGLIDAPVRLQLLPLPSRLVRESVHCPIGFHYVGGTSDFGFTRVYPRVLHVATHITQYTP